MSTRISDRGRRGQASVRARAALPHASICAREARQGRCCFSWPQRPVQSLHHQRTVGPLSRILSTHPAQECEPQDWTHVRLLIPSAFAISLTEVWTPSSSMRCHGHARSSAFQRAVGLRFVSRDDRATVRRHNAFATTPALEVHGNAND